MALEKILIVNDDSPDIIAMRQRLPEEVEVVGASQWDAQWIDDYSVFDIIVVDNDANDRDSAKGGKTVEKIRTKSEVPILYTSFQPVLVPEDVYKTRNVQVVRTDMALGALAQNFDIKLREEVQKKETSESQLNLIITYNGVKGFELGVYGNGKLLIACLPRNVFQPRAGSLAKAVVEGHLDSLYEGFEWRADRDKVRNIFIYDGIAGGDSPGCAAAALGHDIRMRVNLMACGCDWKRKQRLANSTYVDLYKVGCGGQDELGAVADIIMGLQRPDPINLSIPREKILAPAERFKI